MRHPRLQKAKYDPEAAADKSTYDQTTWHSEESGDEE